MSQRDDFVAIAVAQAGKLQYVAGGDRCGWPASGTTDCSGLVSGAAQKVGCDVGPGCPNSSGLARRCHEAPRPAWVNTQFGPDPWTGSATTGTGISQAQARATKGAVKFHGPDQGQDGDGPIGHAGISLGDGRSIEALNRSLDVRIWQFDDNETTYCALLPNMTGFDTAPSPNGDPNNATEGRFMGMVSIACPGEHAQTTGPRKGAFPFIGAVTADGITYEIVGFNGAQLPGALNTSGLSILKLGKLNKPIESASVVFINDPDDTQHDPPHLIATRQVLFTAADGGSFGPYRANVVYHP